ncbi:MULTISPECIES: YHS domain-containing (seleno)protein [unclassified Flammeovirga]|uniref:YHS domain-containing (seleno)protein n=1 Tax=unclassified Flammeovirga TaxID=2637820 RepID=UPI0005C5E442|nr:MULTISPECIES: YHS domain-containing (seleno)protein [unclassified Flammeovirga]MBD0402402.1 YHS domain-containing protein [Flammeovirga sp. EKP202]
MKFKLKVLFVFFCFFSLNQWSYSQTTQDLNLSKGKLAVGGYDVVSYFDTKAVEGEKEFTAEYKGAEYRFISQKHVDKFLANPEKYLPAYGGWCAYAMADKGEKVDVNYETFVVQNGRLMLFYNKFFSNTKEYWHEEGPDKLEKKADANWNKLVN